MIICFLLAITIIPAYGDVKLKPYEDYIGKYASDAMKQQIKYGIPASITLAQGLLESNAGNSELARQSNNHFGIKCNSSWQGPSVEYFDDGKMSCFRKYDDVLDSYNDHSLFLVTRSRYASLFDINVKNYKAWAKGLKEAGYATDKQYDKKLVRIIELYDLNQYTILATRPYKARRLMAQMEKENNRIDTPVKEEPQTKTAVKTKHKAKSSKSVLPKTATRRQEVIRNAKDYHVLAQGESASQHAIAAEVTHDIQYKGSVPYIVVHYGDNYKTIANEFNVSPARLRKLNEWPKDYQIKAGDMVYLGRKGKVWEGENATHIVRENDSVYIIAQQYALQMDALYKLNGMQWGQPLYVGQELKLR